MQKAIEQSGRRKRNSSFAKVQIEKLSSAALILPSSLI